jgi:NAD+ diphosphatase
MPFERFPKGIGKPEKRTVNSLYFIFKNNKLLINKNKKGQYSILSANNLKETNLKPEELVYIGKFEEQDCFSGELGDKKKLADNIFPFDLRKTYSLIGLEFFQIAGYAFGVMDWNKNSHYCGRCGGKLENMEEELAKICSKCKSIKYPVISPAVIVAVTKDDMILLARARRFHGNIYSVLAGFVEVGEALEHCVKREVREEVGIEVKNITYFGSQPWPFPNSLMIAFTAEYNEGEIYTDRKEILDAGWYKADKLPVIPEKPSIARDLIDWFIAKNS